jgi:hypothetical protein
MTDLAHVDLMFHYVLGIFYLFLLGLALGEWLLLNANWDVVRFILDQHADVDLYGEVHKTNNPWVAPLGYIILVPNQQVFAITS